MIRALLAAVLLAACGTQSPSRGTPSQLLDASTHGTGTRLVLVHDDRGGVHDTVTYPVLLTGDATPLLGYRFDCSAGDAMAAVGADRIEDTGLLWDDPSLAAAKIDSNPRLACGGGAGYGKLWRYPVPNRGSRYFVDFRYSGAPTGFTYELGCGNLLTALGLAADQAETINSTGALPYPALRSLSCVKGDALPAHTFLDWCNGIVADASEASKATAAEIRLRAKKQLGTDDCRVIADKVQSDVVLDLTGAGLTDLLPLTALPRLRYALLGGNRIINLQPLKALPELVWVDLSGNPVVDLDPLASLPKLSHLDLARTGVKDLAPLGRMPQVASLALDGNGLHDVASLGSMTGLVALSLNDNALTDARALAPLTGLVSLGLEGNEVPDLAFATGFGQLGRFYASRNGATTAAPLRQLVRLQDLWLRDNQVTDAAPLVDADGLVTVELGGNPIPEDAAHCPVDRGSGALREFCHNLIK